MALSLALSRRLSDDDGPMADQRRSLRADLGVRGGLIVGKLCGSSLIVAFDDEPIRIAC